MIFVSMVLKIRVRMVGGASKSPTRLLIFQNDWALDPVPFLLIIFNLPEMDLKWPHVVLPLNGSLASSR